MGRLSAPLLALALAAVVALGVSACGSGGKADLLPGSTATEITANLNQVKALATTGDCVGAEDAAQAVSSQIEELGGVDKKLKQALREGATRLNEVVANCEEAETEETLPAVEPAEELEEEEPEEKPEKAVKPDKDEKKEEAAEETETDTAPTLPTQAEGKAKGHEKQEEAAQPPAAETGGTSAGGVGPAAPAGSE
jgi:outer membrane biosynthesis protein TonB